MLYHGLARPGFVAPSMVLVIMTCRAKRRLCMYPRIQHSDSLSTPISPCSPTKTAGLGQAHIAQPRNALACARESRVEIRALALRQRHLLRYHRGNLAL
jgi:hypothetical protein